MSAVVFRLQWGRASSARNALALARGEYGYVYDCEREYGWAKAARYREIKLVACVNY